MLTPSELEVYNRVAKMIHELRPIGCTGCGYCQPCTVGINIPEIFDIYNKGYLFGNMERAKKRYSFEKVKASECIECGNCEAQCPQGLPIRELLKKVHSELAGG
jgi:predicted aldo/keto reductase-like oxidoreductase